MMPENERTVPSGPEACREFDRQLADYLEGLRPSAVVEHLKDCTSCAALLAELECLIAESRTPSLEEPSPRIWASLCASLIEEGVIRERGWLLRRWLPAWFCPLPAPAFIGGLAGLFLVAVVLTSQPSGWGRRNTANAPAETQPAIAEVSKTLSTMEHSYRSKPVTLAPEIETAYEQSLAALNTSIAECEKSLHENPTDSLAREYLLSAYEQKAEVLTAALTVGGW